MQKARQKLIVGNLLVLGVGALVGWLYGYPERGLLAGALVALAWQLRQTLVFERALRRNDFENLGYGEGFWSHVVSEFRQHKQRTKTHKKRYRQLLKEVRKSTNAMPDGAIILNDDFEIVTCNAAAKRLAGFRPKQDRGQRVDNIIRDPDFRAYLAKGKFKDSVQIRSPLQEDQWLACRIVPYGAEQRLLLVQDITERQRLTMLRREFVANASHELRSPLTVISGYLDTLAADDDSPASWKKPIQQMLVQANRMNMVVGELLELSRLESAGAAPMDEFVDVAALLAGARRSIGDDRPSAEIVIDLQSTCQLRGSAAEIDTVVINLLSNAVRHTPADGKITLRWSGDAEGGQIVVSDTGIGIEPEHIPRLTERFFRVDTGRSRDQGGVGLGLAIVKHALERHGAVLKVSSTPGEGSEFACHFPSERLLVPEAGLDGAATGDRRTA
jgi:two-component system phosphate regulon sensor histidine kinase PhoR